MREEKKKNFRKDSKNIPNNKKAHVENLLYTFQNK
jgi:hypothetical protein